MLGKWRSIAFVNAIDDFRTDEERNGLYLETIEFYPDGSLVQSYMDKKWYDKWTKEHIINLHRTTAAAYIIKEVNGTEYLFIEWKMGNYIYGGMRPEYYVFKREMSQ